MDDVPRNCQWRSNAKMAQAWESVRNLWFLKYIPQRLQVLCFFLFKAGSRAHYRLIPNIRNEGGFFSLVSFVSFFSTPLEFRTLGRLWLKNARNSSPTQLGMCPAWSSWQAREDCLIRPSLWSHRTWGCTLPHGCGCRPEPPLTQPLLNISLRGCSYRTNLYHQ